MTQEQWTAVDSYITDLLVRPDADLNDALDASAAAGLPSIQVTAAQGKLLMLLAQACGARRILEIGTLGGYSTLWLARALPPSDTAPAPRVITLERDPKHAQVAQSNFNRAGMADRIELILGPAAETLPRLAAEGGCSFDFVFIDADKVSTPDYFTWAMKLARPGALIVVDNVVRKGAVADPASSDASVLAIRCFHDMLASEARASATTLQTVGSKGYDGFTLIRVAAAD